MNDLTRRGVVVAGAALIAGSGAACPVAAGAKKPQPVIFHTDMGGDVDDTWALLLLLRRPELDLKMVVTEGSNAIYRGRLTAKLLALGNRTDVALAIGADGRDDRAAQSDWIGDYQLKDYPRPVATDGAQSMIDLIMTSKERVTVISVGPATTVAEALRREPKIAGKARFVGMFGSVRTGYGAGTKPEIEYNVKLDPKALQTVFAADWPCTITPLDTCGLVALDGALMQTVRQSRDPFARACIRNSEVWLPTATWMPKDFDLTKTSSTLFDAVAVVMAYDESDLVMETLPLAVLDDGMTVIDPKGRRIRVATAWKNREDFKVKMVADLTRYPA